MSNNINFIVITLSIAKDKICLNPQFPYPFPNKIQTRSINQGHDNSMPIAVNGSGSPKATFIQQLHMQVLLDTSQPTQVQPTEVLPVRKVVSFVFYCHEGCTSQPR